MIDRCQSGDVNLMLWLVGVMDILIGVTDSGDQRNNLDQSVTHQCLTRLFRN